MAGAPGFNREDLRLLMALLLVVAWIAINVGSAAYGAQINEQFLSSLGILCIFLIKDWLFKGHESGGGTRST